MRIVTPRRGADRAPGPEHELVPPRTERMRSRTVRVPLPDLDHPAQEARGPGAHGEGGLTRPRDPLAVLLEGRAAQRAREHRAVLHVHGRAAREHVPGGAPAGGLQVHEVQAPGLVLGEGTRLGRCRAGCDAARHEGRAEPREAPAAARQIPAGRGLRGAGARGGCPRAAPKASSNERWNGVHWIAATPSATTPALQACTQVALPREEEPGGGEDEGGQHGGGRAGRVP